MFVILNLGGFVHAQTDLEREVETLRLQLERQQSVIEQQSRWLADQQGRLDSLENHRLPPVPSHNASHHMAEANSSGYAEYGLNNHQVPQGLAFGYSGGFIISSPDGVDVDSKGSDFLMRIGSWGHFRHTVFDSNNANRDVNDFEFERLRLVFNGHAFTPDFQYFFQFDADSDAGEVVDVLDYYLSYDFGHDLFCLKKKQIGFRFGKWKIPFSRAREESGTKLEFVDRSMAGVFFDFNRSLGIGFFGESDRFAKPIEWNVSLVNGINTGGFRPNRADQLDRDFAIAMRFASVLSGDYGSDGEPDLDFRETPAFRVGTGLAYSSVDRIDGLREFGRQRTVDSGASVNDVLPNTVSNYDIYMGTVDSHLKYRGLSVIGEYYFRYLTGFSGAPVADLFDHGFNLQTGYFIVPEKLELLARWSRIKGDSTTLGASDRSADEVAGGAAWYIRGHNLKLIFDATHLNGAPISDSALNILPGDDGWLYRTQCQWKF